MNCDDFLEDLASANERQSSAAKAHADSCPSCAALANVHARLQNELAAREPLPRRLHAAWAAAAEEEPQTTLASRRRKVGDFSPILLLAGVAALLILIVFPLIFWKLTEERKLVREPKNIRRRAPPVVAIKEIDASAELSALLAEVNALEAEMNKTSKQAELLDARREAEVLLATHSQW